ncbi:unnamed protein product [marine sediment metagenome]|uniref:DegT/DnrJ/EryC1/StrS aminotransferase n=1 Tax=marine sediment metagenome TaxID=412755 RepID=X0S3A3_9ZZZZ
MFPKAEQIGDRVVALPLYPKLKASEADYVIRSVKEIAAELKFAD